MIVATAGHIDHGKTTLVKALTGVDTDRLPEEKARGISIDLGFAYWQSPDGRTIGFVDVPGHERFVRNMVAGVCGIDYAMLVIAADDGVMPQTREHLQIIDLLSVTRGIAVISKVDRVDAQRVEQVAAEVRALLAPTGLAGADVVPVSAPKGQGLAGLQAALAEAAGALHRESQHGRRFRYAIDRVFTLPGSGTIVTGTVFEGALAVGDAVRLSPSGRDARVRAIQTHGQAVPAVAAGERCAINLPGVDLRDVARGDWLVHAALHVPTQRLDVRLRLLETEARPLRHWMPVHLYLGTRDVTARVAMRRGAALEPGESAPAQLILEQPVAALYGDRFILRDQSARRTLGGGTVLDPWPPRQRLPAAQRLPQFEALAHGGVEARLRALSACTPGGVDVAAFSRGSNLDEEATAQLLSRCDLVPVGRSPAAVALPKATLEQVGAAVNAALARFHAASPQSAGMEAAALRRECAPALAAPVFLSLLRAMADDKCLEFSGALVRQPRHVNSDNPADQRIWQVVQPALQAAGLAGLTVAQLAADTAQKEVALRGFLQRKVQTGELVRVTPDRFFLRSTMAVFAAAAAEVAKAAPAGRFSPALFRDRIGIGRALAVEVLESLDRLAITRRIGDVRVMRQDFAPILGHATASPPAARSIPTQPQSAPRWPNLQSNQRR